MKNKEKDIYDNLRERVESQPLFKEGYNKALDEVEKIIKSCNYYITKDNTFDETEYVVYEVFEKFLDEKLKELREK